MKALLTTLTLFVCACQVAWAQLATRPESPLFSNQLASHTDSAVHAAALEFMSRPQAVGLSIGVYQNGQMHEYHYGESIKGSAKLPTAQSLYAIASLTKTFTATLLAQAVVEKRLNLEDDVRQHLQGDYPNLEFQGQPIRIVHLINHQSGLPFLLPEIPELLTDTTLTMADIARKIDRPLDRQIFLQALHGVKLDALPGSKSMYSNAGVQLLSFILERIYSMPYEQLLRINILQPLGMVNTKLELGAADQPRLAKAYDEHGHVIPAHTAPFGAAGGLSSTISDMLRYISWQLGEKAEALQLAHRPTVGDFNPYAVGLNWRMLKKDNQRLLWQDGNMIGYSSLCVLHPELDLGMVVLTNQMDRTSAQRVIGLVSNITKQIAPQAIIWK